MNLLIGTGQQENLQNIFRNTNNVFDGSRYNLDECKNLTPNFRNLRDIAYIYVLLRGIRAVTNLMYLKDKNLLNHCSNGFLIVKFTERCENK